MAHDQHRASNLKNVPVLEGRDEVRRICMYILHIKIGYGMLEVVSEKILCSSAMVSVPVR